MKELLTYIVKNLVSEPDAIAITEEIDGDNVTYSLRVAPGDMGRVIGRHPQHLVQRIFNGALHRTKIGLFGPAIESAAVVGQVNAQSCHSHSL